MEGDHITPQRQSRNRDERRKAERRKGKIFHISSSLFCLRFCRINGGPNREIGGVRISTH